MLELATDDYQSVPIPRQIKISSKRQITIPVDIYERQGFKNYALLTETPDGIKIEPMKLVDDDEELTVRLLRYLIDNCYEGDALIEKYEEVKPKFISYYQAIMRSEADIAAGRVADAFEMQERIRAKYGL